MMNDIAKVRPLARNEFMDDNIYEIFFNNLEAAKTAKSHLEIKSAKTIFFDDAQIVDGT